MGQKEKGIFIGDENVQPFHRSYNVFISQWLYKMAESKLHLDRLFLDVYGFVKIGVYTCKSIKSYDQTNIVRHESGRNMGLNGCNIENQN